MEILSSTRLHCDLNELSSDKIGKIYIYKRTKAKLNSFIKDENKLTFQKRYGLNSKSALRAVVKSGFKNMYIYVFIRQTTALSAELLFKIYLF